MGPTYRWLPTGPTYRWDPPSLDDARLPRLSTSKTVLDMIFFKLKLVLIDAIVYFFFWFAEMFCFCFDGFVLFVICAARLRRDAVSNRHPRITFPLRREPSTPAPPPPQDVKMSRCRNRFSSSRCQDVKMSLGNIFTVKMSRCQDVTE